MKLDQLINVYEMFNSTTPISWAGNIEDRLVGTFEIDGSQFHLLLEPGYYKSPDIKQTYTFLNVAFSRVVDGKDVFDLTPGGPFTSKVLGAVKQGVEEQTNVLTRFDAVVFVARDNQQKRMSLYNKLGRLWAKSFGTILENVQCSNGALMTIIVKRSQETNAVPFIDYLKAQCKI